MEFSAKVRTCLTFEKNGHEAAEFYVSLLPNSAIENRIYPDENGAPMVVEFNLSGAPYMILNGPSFPTSEAASISVLTEDQEETDHLWAALIADGGAESQCGWLKDRFGISWQIVPKTLPLLLNNPDREGADRAMRAMLTMSKINVAAIEAAFNAK
ncbi:VOC family protein (plasmid) [Falsihalocynthiibacter sp. SS001]|uniref:VOC family protein n=1 Tax=Falsihalocynthiibacter sp. SS001 TaxID=3349698 RepID=UPI0036D26E15